MGYFSGVAGPIAYSAMTVAGRRTSSTIAWSLQSGMSPGAAFQWCRPVHLFTDVENPVFVIKRSLLRLSLGRCEFIAAGTTTGCVHKLVLWRVCAWVYTKLLCISSGGSYRLVGTHFGAVLMYVCKHSLRPTMSLSRSDPVVISHIASDRWSFAFATRLLK